MEILRFILSICVVLTHIDFLNGTEFAYLKLMGGVAVTSFFILSGYIIPKALDLNYFKRGGVLMGGGRYIANRALRVYPMYWLAILIVFIDYVYLNKTFLYDGRFDFSSLQTLSFNLFLPPFTDRTKSLYIPVAWSLKVEFAWYVLAPIIFSILYLLPNRILKYKIRTLAILALIATYLFVKNEISGLLGDMSGYTLFFLSGALLYAVESDFNFYLRGYFASLVVISIGIYSGIIGINVQITLTLLTLVVISAQKKSFSKKSQFIRFLGDISYPIFILHLTYVNNAYLKTYQIISPYFNSSDSLLTVLCIISSLAFVILQASIVHLLFGRLIDSIRVRIRK